MKKIYTAIDIGSDTIKFVVAEKCNNNVNVLATHIEKSKGIRKEIQEFAEKRKRIGNKNN